MHSHKWLGRIKIPLQLGHRSRVEEVNTYGYVPIWTYWDMVVATDDEASNAAIPPADLCDVVVQARGGAVEVGVRWQAVGLHEGGDVREWRFLGGVRFLQP